jgi:hypothetical protein
MRTNSMNYPQIRTFLEDQFDYEVKEQLDENGTLLFLIATDPLTRNTLAFEAGMSRLDIFKKINRDQFKHIETIRKRVNQRISE